MWNDGDMCYLDCPECLRWNHARRDYMVDQWTGGWGWIVAGNFRRERRERRLMVLRRVILWVIGLALLGRIAWVLA